MPRLETPDNGCTLSADGFSTSPRLLLFAAHVQVHSLVMPRESHTTVFGAARPHVFATTHWSVVLSAGQAASPSAAAALEELCRTYWYPLYAFVRCKGHSPHDAQDLTQAFFGRLLGKNYVAQADRERGRFRTFLLAALSHFLADEWDKQRRIKRGGGQVMISFDGVSAEERYRLEPIGQLDPAKLYERRWVTTLFDNVLARLKQEFNDSGKGKLFDHLRSALLVENKESSYAQLGLPLGLKEDAVKQAVHRMRRRYRELFRQEIAQTVAEPSEVEDELKHLFAILSEGP
jgi:DNA-directed RNA polymerase specialized sigma24 family protein